MLELSMPQIALTMYDGHLLSKDSAKILQQNALSILNSRRRDQRPALQMAIWDAPATLNTMPTLEGQLTLKGRPSLAGMKEWLIELGHTV
jgi:hypothetical protein